MSTLHPQPVIEHVGEPHCRRFSEQRWTIDNIIQANGIDWDQARSFYLQAPCGIESLADFAAIRQRVKKMADIGPAFEATARRREQRARLAEEADEMVSARENYFMAAVHWGASQWTYDENNEQNIFLNQKKRACYANYARLADHRVEPVWIPFKDTALPAWYHLPPDYVEGRKVPAVVAIPGMDSFKECAVALNGDRWLNRGIAVLAIDGPGQYEAPLLGIRVNMENWIAAAPALYNWLAARPEINADKIGVTGTSFGSFFGTIVVANEPRFRAAAVSATCLEPGCHTIFEEASPTFKKRFMWMAGYTDEAKFDQFVKTLTWEGHVERIKCPYLCLAGEAEELSPLSYTEKLFAQLKAPKRLVVYQDARHGISGVPAVALGPSPPVLIADWMMARLAGKAFPSERWYVTATGQVNKTAY
ncbi:MAG TPA: prolyl oligopeptidase family serine peptidase [Stellaceae bacterium]|nr:prolyl oligopeptidase family serine peptidase [Stellaceae bacterium]